MKKFILIAAILLGAYLISPFIFQSNKPTPIQKYKDETSLFPADKIFFVSDEKRSSENINGAEEVKKYISDYRLSANEFRYFITMSGEQLQTNLGLVIDEVYFKENEWWNFDANSYCFVILHDKGNVKYEMPLAECPQV